MQRLCLYMIRNRISNLSAAGQLCDPYVIASLGTPVRIDEEPFGRSRGFWRFPEGHYLDCSDRCNWLSPRLKCCLPVMIRQRSNFQRCLTL